MDLLVLIGQRKERYEGEYSPEAIAVIDAIGNDENPDYMSEQQAEARDSGDFAALAVLRIRVPGGVVTEKLFPAASAIDGQVI